jgi:hypothetical protein
MQNKQVECRLLVSTDAPNLILSVETSLIYFMGYSPQELIGKEIRILQGLETDAGLLNSALDQPSTMKCQINLYEQSGLKKNMDVSFEPHFGTEQNKRCILMVLAPSEGQMQASRNQAGMATPIMASGVNVKQTTQESYYDKLKESINGMVIGEIFGWFGS